MALIASCSAKLLFLGDYAEPVGLQHFSQAEAYGNRLAVIAPPEDLKEFLQRIDNVSIATRYPEDLRALSKEFNQQTVKRILTDTKRMIKWFKQHMKSGVSSPDTLKT